MGASPRDVAVFRDWRVELEDWGIEVGGLCADEADAVLAKLELLKVPVVVVDVGRFLIPPENQTLMG